MNGGVGARTEHLHAGHVELNLTRGELSRFISFGSRASTFPVYGDDPLAAQLSAISSSTTGPQLSAFEDQLGEARRGRANR